MPYQAGPVNAHIGKGGGSFSSSGFLHFIWVPRTVAACSQKVLSALACYERWAEVFMHGVRNKRTLEWGACNGSCSATAFACESDRKP